tara:strand:- start:404 stop:514 length:111 start_codon:yes stop_codon:yes gene_type:complete
MGYKPSEPNKELPMSETLITDGEDTAIEANYRGETS